MGIMHDIAILGATPAGYAAAYWLARRGYGVAMVEAPRREAESPLADWVPGDFFRIEGLPKSLAKLCKAVAFRRVCYHSADLSRQVEHSSARIAGYFLQSESLGRALKAQAVKAGAKVRATKTSPAVRLNEDAVRILGTTQTEARILIVTHGTPGQVSSDLSLPILSVRESPLVVAGLEAPLAGASGGKLGGALHVVETSERNEFGLFFAAGDVLHLRMISFSRASGNRAAELSAMLTGLQQTGILPAKLPLARARGAVWRPPAGVASETETHVAKRCLLAGTAGGFADSITGQTLLPSVKSALIAARMAAAALGSKDLQAALVKYKTAWRHELEEYLRPPSTSLQMLLPLLFVNKRIVARFTGALLFGENI